MQEFAVISSRPRLARTKDILRQAIHYYGVSAAAAATHFLMVFILVEAGHLRPEFANVIAFVAAFTVNYLGQLRLTFNCSKHNYMLAAVLFGSFLMNQSFFVLFRHISSMHYLVLLGFAVVCSSLIAFPLGRRFTRTASGAIA